MPKGNPKAYLNAPTTGELSIEPGGISRDITLQMELASLPKIDLKDPEQIRKRCSEYFEFCIKNDTRPTVSGLCLSLKCVRQRLWEWANDDDERGRVVKAAKDIINSLVETWAVSGRMSPPVAIFWSKNLLGYNDEVTLTAVDNRTLRAERSPAELAKLIEEDIPIDGD